jgi:SAM-dependent methyltransferase
MKLFRVAEQARRLFEWRALRLGRQACSLCGFPMLVKFGTGEHAVRCLRCGANPVTMSLVEALLQNVPDISTRTVYELSSRGPLFGYLQNHAGKLIYSEFFDDVPPGSAKNGVPCQDVQNLTWPDQSFDLCTSSDVFEHVPDDARAFAEICRVLRPGGTLVFTVPMKKQAETVERAILVGDQIEHLLPPEYHDDHIRGLGQVLCYRNYGADIVTRLKDCGFADAEIVAPDDSRWWGHGRPVVVARRSEES